jgi:hypothetical protein
MFGLEIEHPAILKVIHLDSIPSPSFDKYWYEPCVECGKFYSIIFLVIDEERNIYRKTGCMQEVLMCPSCFYFLFALNPSQRGEIYH